MDRPTLNRLLTDLVSAQVPLTVDIAYAEDGTALYSVDIDVGTALNIALLEQLIVAIKKELVTAVYRGNQIHVE
jgi:hypothetical protein